MYAQPGAAYAPKTGPLRTPPAFSACAANASSAPSFVRQKRDFWMRREATEFAATGSPAKA